MLLFKGLAWSVSLGSFRGGPTVPGDVPRAGRRSDRGEPLGLSETAMIAIGIGAMTVSMLRLPLSSVILAIVVTQAGCRSRR